MIGQALQMDRRATTLWFHRILNHGLLPIILVLTYVGFGLMEPRFFSLDNFWNILRQGSYLVILTTAQMFALLTRGLDLSIGNVVSMISVATALVISGVLEAYPDAVALALTVGLLSGLGLGFLTGMVNGICVAFLRINPFIVTLGMMGIASGIATTLSGGFPVFDMPRAYTDIFNQADWLGVPAPTMMCIVILIIAYLLLNHTIIGRSLYILGGNPQAAYVAGLNSRYHHAMAYVVCSAFAAVAALLLTARTGSGEPSMGGGLMFESIAAAVIGGVSLRGGKGGVLHCILGGLFVTVLSIGMNILRVNGYLQMTILGSAMIAAVYFAQLRNTSRS